MNPENLHSPNEEYDPNLDAQDEDVLSGGNNRLTYILLALIVALVVGYIALPKGGGSGMSSVTPSFMLDDAAVTAAVPAAADSGAAGPQTATATAPETGKATTKTPVATAKTAAPARPAADAPAETAPAEAAAPVAAAPAPAAPAPAPVVAPAAPATISGRIEDENGRPLVGATVLLKGSSKGTSTDAGGNYTLEVPAGSDNTLVYGYGGYDDEVQRVNDSKSMNVTLTPRVKAGRRRR